MLSSEGPGAGAAIGADSSPSDPSSGPGAAFRRDKCQRDLFTHFRMPGKGMQKRKLVISRSSRENIENVEHNCSAIHLQMQLASLQIVRWDRMQRHKLFKNNQRLMIRAGLLVAEDFQADVETTLRKCHCSPYSYAGAYMLQPHVHAVGWFRGEIAVRRRFVHCTARLVARSTEAPPSCLDDGLN